MFGWAREYMWRKSDVDWSAIAGSSDTEILFTWFDGFITKIDLITVNRKRDVAKYWHIYGNIHTHSHTEWYGVNSEGGLHLHITCTSDFIRSLLMLLCVPLREFFFLNCIQYSFYLAVACIICSGWILNLLQWLLNGATEMKISKTGIKQREKWENPWKMWRFYISLWYPQNSCDGDYSINGENHRFVWH